jgi:hypothetical protein
VAPHLPNKVKSRLVSIRANSKPKSKFCQKEQGPFPCNTRLPLVSVGTFGLPPPSSMATTSNPGSRQKQPASSSSRFASLKVFKFAAGSSKHSPPIPPPKENYTSTNNSLVSLTSESSTPMTPVTPDFTRSQSTSPFPPAHSPAPSSQGPTSASSSSSFGKGLIKFAKRSLTPKPATRQLPEPLEDSSISLPWNFQVCLFFSSLINAPSLESVCHLYSFR